MLQLSWNSVLHRSMDQPLHRYRFHPYRLLERSAFPSAGGLLASSPLSPSHVLPPSASPFYPPAASTHGLGNWAAFTTGVPKIIEPVSEADGDLLTLLAQHRDAPPLSASERQRANAHSSAALSTGAAANSILSIAGGSRVTSVPAKTSSAQTPALAIPSLVDNPLHFGGPVADILQDVFPLIAFPTATTNERSLA
ncbi:MAG: hypothetical protein EOO65_01795, partial [Methanosarcinales archaeon]